MMLVPSLTQQMIKDFRSLQLKKHRDRLGLFIAEGRKLVEDLLGSQMVPQWLLTCDEELFNLWRRTFSQWGDKVVLITQPQMKSVSALQTPAESLGVFLVPAQGEVSGNWTAESGWGLVLDGIQNPGNLGSILRSADWFGFTRIFCGLGTADVFGSKGVQATMGSLARVKIWYGDVTLPLKEAHRAGWPVVGAQLEGTSIYDWREGATAPDGFPDAGLLVLGSEGQGIGSACGAWVQEWITIPSFGERVSSPESLNVGAAAAVLLSEIKRKLSVSQRQEK